MATPVPRDSPYKIIFSSFTPIVFSIHSDNTIVRLDINLVHVGLPSFPLNPLQAKMIKLISSLEFFNSFNL